jgi:hypothetical protein
LRWQAATVQKPEEVVRMLDSLLTLTKGEAFWMAVAFAVLVLAHWAVSFLTGVMEPVFLLGALLVPVAFLVMGAYTLGKKALHR